MKFEKSPNVALLIDADNSSSRQIDQVLSILAELGNVNIRRAYGNWSKASLKGWENVARSNVIESVQQFDVTKNKNATDMRMAIDAMDLLYSGRVDSFGLMSSDSDFAPLVMRLRQNNLPVYGFGMSKTPSSFQDACTRFIDLEGLAAPGVGSDAGAGKPSGKKITRAVVKTILEAITASKRDDRGFASLSEVGKRVNSLSSFDARSFGFSRLSDMMAAIDVLELERREGNAVFVKQLR